MKEHRFTVIIEHCEEGGYFAVCPALPGCHTEGETFEEVLEHIRDAIRLYIEDLTACGEDVPDDTCETVTSVKIAV